MPTNDTCFETRNLTDATLKISATFNYVEDFLEETRPNVQVNYTGWFNHNVGVLRWWRRVVLKEVKDTKEEEEANKEGKLLQSKHKDSSNSILFVLDLKLNVQKKKKKTR